MAFFTQDPSQPRLYVAQTTGDDRGWLGCVLPADVEHPATLELRQAFPGPELMATLLFAPAAPLRAPSDLVADVDAILAQNPGSRALLWLTDLRRVDTATVRVMPLRGDGLRSAAALNAILVPVRLTLQVGNFASLALPEGSFTARITPVESPIVFTGASRPTTGTITGADLPFTGPQRGCLLFAVDIERASLAGPERLRWGFQMMYPTGDVDRPLASEWYPLAGEHPYPSDLLGFQASVDPADPVNAAGPGRTWFAFTGTTLRDGNPVPTTLESCFRTRYGAGIRLHPVGVPHAGGELRAARLSIALGAADAVKGTEFTLQPEGDFAMEAAAAANGGCELLCGLSGTESITFRPRAEGLYAGDRLRFTPAQGALAPHFPLPEVSTVGPPVDPEAPLLAAQFVTAWATVRRDPTASEDPVYRVQPSGAPLYGHRQGEGWAGALSLVETGYRLPQAGEMAFPLLPYACAPADAPGFGPAALQQFEAQIVAPTRRAAIARAGAPPAGVGGEGEIPATTPTGVVVSIDAPTGTWNRVVLGRNDAPVPIELAFELPDAVLQQALQSEGLFLVVANGDHLGTPLGYPPPPLNGAPPEQAEFRNSMTVEEWAFVADVGRANRYADYRSVMIVKGGVAPRAQPGALADAAPAGSILDLVRNPSLWTAASSLGAPADLAGAPPVPGTPDPAELPVLSQWLQDYFAAAAARAGDPLYERFNRIAADPAWTGVLVLRARVAAVPQQLRGLLGGIDPARFEVHHFGVELNQVDPETVTLQDTSAVFGLIDYRAQGYLPAQGARPIAPEPGAVYDFKVLTLQALFENAAVRDFRSLAQLTLNDVFALPVQRMGDPANPYNSIVLRGSYQHDGGVTTYVLDSEDDSTFYLDSTVLRRVEVVKARFTTLAAGSAGAGMTAGRFDLWGFMDFAVLEQTVKGSDGGESPVLDLFSFGNRPGKDDPRQGLSFSGLGIGMVFPDLAPEQRTLTFDAGKVAFDPGRSTPREGSLFRDFALSVEGLAAGTGEATPQSQGFLRVATEVGLLGVSAPWYGLRFRLVMGTPGELAGRASLTSGLLAAWGRGSGTGYPAYAGLALPGTGGGAKLISLQGVLKLAVGDLKLSRVPIAGDPEGRRSYLLNLSDIALKFLGLLKLPPNGSTQFYLFGNPDGGGKPGELGWYAIYNQDVPKAPTAPTPPALAAAVAEDGPDV